MWLLLWLGAASNARTQNTTISPLQLNTPSNANAPRMKIPSFQLDAPPGSDAPSKTAPQLQLSAQSARFVLLQLDTVPHLRNSTGSESRRRWNFVWKERWNDVLFDSSAVLWFCEGRGSEQGGWKARPSGHTLASHIASVIVPCPRCT